MHLTVQLSQNFWIFFTSYTCITAVINIFKQIKLQMYNVSDE